MNSLFTNTAKRVLNRAPVVLCFFVLMQWTESCGNKGGGTELASSEARNKLGPLISIPLYMTESQTSKLSLVLQNLGLTGSAPGGVTPSAITYNLAGCASGLSGTPASSTVVNVYKNDTLCYVTLVAFTMHGTVYNLTNSGFVTWNTALSSGTTGQYATFASSTAGDVVVVKVISQLSSPISTSDYVSFELTTIQSGTNSASITVGTAQSLYSAGQDAPNFKINSGDATFDNIVSSGGSAGAGMFTFKLTCTVSAMTVGANASYNSFCPTITPGGTIAGGASGVDVGVASNFSYKLINDINSNGTLTLAQAQTAFASGDSTVTLATDILPGSTGFKTISLTGPATIQTNLKMILVLQAKNTNSTYSSNPAYSSFQYFYISLPTMNP